MSKHTAKERETPLISNRMYDTLKWIAQLFLPSLGALYFALSQIWGFPNGEEVVGTIVAVDAFLGALLGLSTHSYNQSQTKYDGALLVDESDERRDIYTFEVNTPLEDLSSKRELLLKVTRPN